ncbi:MAG TPA: VWA domain-containing protein [Bryobacteraceae bacterium]|nr:VWA domain-containing protein [Bryobacteraceae bacterium]
MKPAWLITGILSAVFTIAVAQDTAPQEAPKSVGDPGEAKARTAPVGPPATTINLPPPPPDPNEFRVSSDVEMVLLDVSVKDHDGGFVSGLKMSDFTVLENKTSQNLTVFQAQDVPVTVGLVVDNSGSVRNKKPEIVTAALTFVTNSNPNDEVFVVNFNDRVMMGLPDDIPFSADSRLLRQALLLNPARGRTALYDALMTALDHLEKGRLDKKTLVLISDGGDNMSQATKEELLRRAEESLVTIYTVGIYDLNDRDRNPGFLKELARITGGESYLPGESKELVPTCEKIAHDIRNRYTLGYVPSNRDFDGKPRKLRVMAAAPNGKKYTVRTRTHYIAASSRSASTRSRENAK